METLEQFRCKLVSLCVGTKLDEGVHTVTFQPLKARVNQDRVMTEKWNISGQTWLFLAVCDGHGGTETPKYTVQYLPGRIHAALQTLCSPTDGLDPNVKEQFQESISALLSEEIERFDREIGEAVTTLCKDPRKLMEAQARLLVEKHAETLSRAYHGTTLTFALINLTREGLWVAWVGDLTVSLSCTNPDGTRSGEKLLDLHTPTTPSEYFRVSMSHPAAEQDIFSGDRLLGTLSMTRAIGNFLLRFHSSLTQLFSYLPTTASSSYISGITKYSKTPPYVIAKPSLRYINLQPF
ncbi:hypothetical protein PILCRDRAFT_13408 [Piloderma croceum F 1598]|uniref:protein-serine/threonine phosphatase n=1 Tax=Piloderma croceum (strain F 1598) TaxID=765440 RepID=A0A0C3BEA2_PILCF|nr:hypothetical protein PILCRDRAFT_13408 [Piloderma croceum F 1598]